MPLLRNRAIVENDRWIVPSRDDACELLPDHALNLDTYLALKEQRAGDLIECRALVVNGDDDAQLLVQQAPQMDLIAIEFPVLRDGRGFSLAYLLRRSGFKGELRAVGATSRDKLAYLERCGFDAVELDDEHFNERQLHAFNEISVHYQGSADDSRPIYRQ